MRVREPINMWTHFAGIILAAIGLTVMVWRAVLKHNPSLITGVVVFGVSMILLYTASTVYHGFNGKKEIILRLRKLDHAMIFVLIAGTYTPICLTALKGKLGYGLLIAVWSLAIIGIVTKVIFINMPRWLSAGMYLFLGWLSIAFIYPIFKAMPVPGFVWLCLGGVFYTVGSIIYAIKSDKLRIGAFGFHEIFHLFILLGTISHFIMVNNYMM
ncbi:hemolysin III family protein [Fusibacter paucivorans]|uniref:Hemolysin III family protein n=1 Tax=Fusibacter paucivorans TaxID=76009 RepID=A0ABS5PQM3_9FIRM|nr:hemolysin III family protein [Fusibacter paucivorans]MBS7527212.1 hemolysin III family protein [Fusibacter paucivorans]